MILIADSGSTKTQWALVDANKAIYFYTEGLNPYFVDSNKVKEALQLVVKEFDISKVYFYGAGCNNEEKNKIIRNGIIEAIPCKEIFIESDVYGAARALFGKEKGWVGIIGTGSNVAYYDGKNIIKHTVSLGYILGDEGSGAHIGKEFLKKLFYKELPLEIQNEFKKHYTAELPEVLTNIYSQPFPNRYLAQFTEFIFKYKETREIKDILLFSFNELFDRHIIPYYQQGDTMSFIGSVAFIFKDELNEIAQNYGIYLNEVLKNPLPRLVEYHQKEFL
ncbi:MAG: ATPase [Bacteroidales bacterium]|nr:ATPase [Bacteroidales bacterium]